MRKFIGFALLIVLLVTGACTQAQPQATVDPTPDSFMETATPPAVAESEQQSSALSDAVNTEDEHQECTYVEHSNCSIDTSAYEAQNESTGADDSVTEAAVESSHTVDKLLLDYEIIFYQSDYESETLMLSEVFANEKPTVLVFWAGLCPVCRREMPEIQAAYDTYGDRVNFVGIDVGLFTNLGSKDDALTMINDLGLTFPMGVTLDYNVMPTYEVTAVPTTLFMKPDGNLIRKESRMLGQDALFEHIDTLLQFSEG